MINQFLAREVCSTHVGTEHDMYICIYINSQVDIIHRGLHIASDQMVWSLALSREREWLHPTVYIFTILQLHPIHHCCPNDVWHSLCYSYCYGSTTQFVSLSLYSLTVCIVVVVSPSLCCQISVTQLRYCHSLCHSHCAFLTVHVVMLVSPSLCCYHGSLRGLMLLLWRFYNHVCISICKVQFPCSWTLTAHAAAWLSTDAQDAKSGAPCWIKKGN